MILIGGSWLLSATPAYAECMHNDGELDLIVQDKGILPMARLRKSCP